MRNKDFFLFFLITLKEKGKKRKEIKLRGLCYVYLSSFLTNNSLKFTRFKLLTFQMLQVLLKYD